jgi:hypothetical protein
MNIYYEQKKTKKGRLTATCVLSPADLSAFGAETSSNHTGTWALAAISHAACEHPHTPAQHYIFYIDAYIFHITRLTLMLCKEGPRSTMTEGVCMIDTEQTVKSFAGLSAFGPWTDSNHRPRAHLRQSYMPGVSNAMSTPNFMAPIKTSPINLVKTNLTATSAESLPICCQ